MKILFTGLPYFGKQLVAELNAFDPKNKYIFCNTYYSKKDQLRFLWHLPTAKKVVSFNGVTSESRSLNWALKLKKKLIMQWHGTDVLTAKENKSKGVFQSKYVDAAKSFTDAPWLKSELAALNIVAEELAFKHVPATHDLNPFPTADVMTYLAQDKEVFYGLDHLLKLADEFPQIRFHVAGSDGKSSPPKKNIIWYGWISESEFQNKLNSCAVFIRLTKHDGYALSVLRALANGNYVLWNQPHPAVTFVQDSGQLSTELKSLLALLDVKRNSRNVQAIEWAAQNLNRETILKKYIETILK